MLALGMLLSFLTAARADDQAIIKRLVLKGGKYDNQCLTLGLGCDDNDLAELCELGCLESLNLVGPGFTDNGLRAIRGIRGLTGIGLVNVKITDEGLRHLEGVQGLTLLIMYDCPEYTDTAVARLRKALPKCRIIH